MEWANSINLIPIENCHCQSVTPHIPIFTLGTPYIHKIVWRIINACLLFSVCCQGRPTP